MRYLLAFTAFSVALLLAACSGGGNEQATRSPAATTPASTSSASAGKNTVNVTLKEWEITLDGAKAKAGEITFNVQNKGPKEEHEFVILKTNLALDKLPALADGSADEKGSGVTDVGEVEGIGAGANSTGTFQLEPGSYVFICNIVEQGAEGQIAHYVQGMRTAFTVQ